MDLKLNVRPTFWVDVDLDGLVVPEVVGEELGEAAPLLQEFAVRADLRDGSVYQDDDLVDVR